MHFSQQQLVRLLFLKEQECLQAAPNSHRRAFRRKDCDAGVEWDPKRHAGIQANLNHIPLLFLVLREVYGLVPTIISGYTMVHRAPVLVAYDPIARRTALAVTGILTCSTNLSPSHMARAVPPFCRDYMTAHGIDAVTLLAPRMATTIIEGMAAYDHFLGRQSRADIQKLYRVLRMVDGSYVLYSNICKFIAARTSAAPDEYARPGLLQALAGKLVLQAADRSAPHSPRKPVCSGNPTTRASPSVRSSNTIGRHSPANNRLVSSGAHDTGGTGKRTSELAIPSPRAKPLACRPQSSEASRPHTPPTEALDAPPRAPTLTDHDLPNVCEVIVIE
eukprot:m.10530 g.10530  ORF g.10530 m.10530 type:complete len:333 (+) comp2534_c0_seq1:1482-2480(+)